MKHEVRATASQIKDIKTLSSLLSERFFYEVWLLPLDAQGFEAWGSNQLKNIVLSPNVHRNWQFYGHIMLLTRMWNKCTVFCPRVWEIVREYWTDERYCNVVSQSCWITWLERESLIIKKKRARFLLQAGRCGSFYFSSIRDWYSRYHRYQIIYSKRVTHAVKMADSCLRENGVGVLCTVARSWLLFLHDEGEWKILNQILLEVLMNCTEHFDLRSSLTESCVARFMICWVCRLYFSWLVSSVLSLDECLIKSNYGRFCVAPRKLCRLVWHRVWLIRNVKICFYYIQRFSYERWLSFLLGKHSGVLHLDQVFRC